MGYTNVNYPQGDLHYQFNFHDKEYEWIADSIPATLECGMTIYKKLAEDDYIQLKYEILHIPSEYFDFEKEDLEDDYVVYKAEFSRISDFLQSHENLKTIHN